MRVNKEKPAIITVYLSLSLGIILSFIVSTIECARLNTVRTYFNRVLQTSMESSLCDYYLPLFEDYHLFSYDLGAETLEKHKEKLSSQVMEKINDSLEPEKRSDELMNVWNESTHNFLMCNPQLRKVDLDNVIYLSNDGGVYAKNQMVAYMKYQAPIDLLNMALEAKGTIEDDEKTSKVLDEKMSVESGMADIDHEVLSLVQSVDGIETNEYGIKVSKSSKNISVNDVFIKQVVTSNPSMQSVHVNNAQVYKDLKGSYLNFPKELDGLIAKSENLMAIAKALESFDTENCTDEELEAYQEMVEVYEQGYQEASQTANYLTETITQIDQIVDQALLKIDIIEEKRSQLMDSYENYLDHINDLKGEISEDIFQELSNGVESIEQYANITNNDFSLIKNLQKMKQTLEDNQKLLKEAMASPPVSFSLEEGGFQQWVSGMNTWREKLYGLSTDGLEFDYSAFKPNSEGIDPVEFINKLLGSSFNGLIFDPDEVSDGKLTGIELPSSGSDYSEGFPHMNDKELTMGRIFTGGLGLSNWNLAFKNKDNIQELADDLLLNSYVSDHMTNFTSKEHKAGQVINYEQEYILSGDLEEKESLNYVKNKLLVIRTLMNSVSTIFDAEKSAKAEKTAQAMVGWLPIAGLSQVVKYIILIYWGYCEAILEVSALFHGKSIPIYTTKENFKVEYTDILKINRTYIKDKVSRYECSSKLKLSYSEYLYVLMLFVSDENIVYRSLDLIQENLRHEYDESYRVKNCLISYSCEASGYMKQKFLFLPFFRQHDITIDGYNITSQTAVTY